MSGYYYKEHDYHRYKNLHDKKLREYSKRIRIYLIAASTVFTIALLSLPWLQYKLAPDYHKPIHANGIFITISILCTIIIPLIILFISYLFDRGTKTEFNGKATFHPRMIYAALSALLIFLVAGVCIYYFLRLSDYNAFTKTGLLNGSAHFIFSSYTTEERTSKSVSIMRGLSTFSMTDTKYRIQTRGKDIIFNREESKIEDGSLLLRDFYIPPEKEESFFGILFRGTVSRSALQAVVYCGNDSLGSFTMFPSEIEKIKISGILLVSVLSPLTYGVVSFWLVLLMLIIPRKIYAQISDEDMQFRHCYLFHFYQSVLHAEPNVIVGTFLLLLLSVFPGYVIASENYKILSELLFKGIAFYSFWITSVNWSIIPILRAYERLSDTMWAHSSQTIVERMLPNLKDHVILIGYGNLGTLLLKYCFFDLHPEGYGSPSLEGNTSRLAHLPVKDFSDYGVIIDKQLKIYLVSKRVLVIEKNEGFFKLITTHSRGGRMGLVAPGSVNPRLNGLMVLGIVGDANDPYVLADANYESSQVIINSTSKKSLSYKLVSGKYINHKTILSIDDTPSFESLIGLTYNRYSFIIDIQMIEGISVAQRIFMQMQKKGVDKSKVMIIGREKTIFYVIQVLTELLIAQQVQDVSKMSPREVIEKNLVIFTDDNIILQELEDRYVPYDTKSGTDPRRGWRIFPIRNGSTTIDDLFTIGVIPKKIDDYENYVDAFSFFTPDIVVSITHSPAFGAAIMSKAIISVKLLNTSENGGFFPHFIVYSNKSDRHIVESQLLNYFLWQSKLMGSHPVIGYPTQTDRDSYINREYITANQFSSMLRALLLNPVPSNERAGETSHVAEITFNLPDKPGAITCCLHKISGLQFLPKCGTDSYLVPSFIYGYSFNDRRYRDTFIFTGTAKLYTTGAQENQGESVFGFLNCEGKQAAHPNSVVPDTRTAFWNMLEKNMIEDRASLKVTRFSQIELNRLGGNKECALTTVLKHLELEHDITTDSRLFTFPLQCNLNSTPSKSEFSHIKVWAESLYPGSYANVMAELLLGETKWPKTYPSQMPFVYFSSSNPHIHDNAIKYGRFSIYSKIWDNDTFCELNSLESDIKGRSFSDWMDYRKRGTIRAVKVKLCKTITIFDSQNDWKNYMQALQKHLNKLHADRYVLYYVQKTVPGNSVTFHSKYFNPSGESFVIHHSIEATSISRYSNLDVLAPPSGMVVDEFHEFVIIRRDLIPKHYSDAHAWNNVKYIENL